MQFSIVKRDHLFYVFLRVYDSGKDNMIFYKICESFLCICNCEPL